MDRSAIVCDYPAPTAINVKVGCSHADAGRTHLSSASGLIALLADIGATSGSCAGGYGCSPGYRGWTSSSSGTCATMARGVGASSGTASSTGRPGRQPTCHGRRPARRRRPPTPTPCPPGQTRVAGTQQLQPDTGQGPEQGTEGDATGPAGGQPAPQKSGGRCEGQTGEDDEPSVPSTRIPPTTWSASVLRPRAVGPAVTASSRITRRPPLADRGR
jgi:hypothetical protein